MARLLSLGQPRRTTSRVDPRNRKTLAAVVSLILSLGAFVFVDREARAQQHPHEAQQRHIEVARHVVIDGEDAEHVAGTLHAESPKPELPDESTPPLDSLPPIPEYHLGTGSEPTSSAHGPLDRYELQVSLAPQPGPSIPEALEHYKDEVPLDPGPTPGENSWPELVPTSDPEPVSLEPVSSGSVYPGDPHLARLLVPTPEPVTFEENESLPSWTEEAPTPVPSVPDSEQKESPPLSTSSGMVVSSAAGTRESATNVLASLTDGGLLRSSPEDEGSTGTALANLFAEGAADLAYAVEGNAEDTRSPSDGTESPLRDTPRPSSPFVPTPVGSGYFSLSGSGELGPGGVVPILLCVLVSVSILLRRDGRISWAFCGFSKPSSALLVPLERPG